MGERDKEVIDKTRPKTDAGKLLALVVRDQLASDDLDVIRAEAAAESSRLAPLLSVFWADPDFRIGRFPPLERADLIDHGVTLRERVRQFSVVTGAAAEGEPDLDWQALASERSAFAVYMGVGNAPLLRKNLLAAGADPATPVVIVENGTLESERAFATTLCDLTDCVATLAVGSPAVIFVGLDWDEAGLCRPETVTVYRRRQPAANVPALDDTVANAEAAL